METEGRARRARSRAGGEGGGRGGGGSVTRQVGAPCVAGDALGELVDRHRCGGRHGRG